MIARALLTTALLVCSVLTDDARADDTALLFVVGGSAGTISVATAPAVLIGTDGHDDPGSVTAHVVDARLVPPGWTLSVSTTECTAVWPSAAGTTVPTVTIHSRQVHTPLSPSDVTDVDTALTVQNAGDVGAYVCPLTQTVS